MKIQTLIAFAILPSIPLFAQDQTNSDKGRKDGMQAAFSKKDADGDGFLSKDEFLSSAKNPANAGANFAKKDKNSDGKLSLDEFAPKSKKGGEQ